MRLSIVWKDDLTYHASWCLDGDTARVVGGYGSSSDTVAPGENAEDIAKAMLTELVTAWWVKVRAELPPANMLPVNEPATADEVMVKFKKDGELFECRRVVSIESDGVFALIPAGGEQVGPPRLRIDPEEVAEVYGDDTLRTGTWLYCLDFDLSD